MSTFSGLSGALSALHAQRRALEVGGNNIANANTEGYSRQRANLQAIGPGTIAGAWSKNEGTGFGVDVESVERLRDSFLESRGLSEHTRNSYLAAQKSVYKSIENVFAEPSDTALAAQLGDFWGAWADAANQPKEAATRAALIQRGTIVVEGLSTAHSALSTQWANHRGQLDAHVSDINLAASTVASLNAKILLLEDSGLPTNELADERDLRVMHLAKLAGATSSVRANGSVDLFLSGSTLVSGDVVRELEAVGAYRMQDYSADPTSPLNTRLRWVDGSQSTATMGGTVGSSLETLGVTLRQYAGELDNIAAKLAGAVNVEHVNGFSADNSTGLVFFTGSTASDLRVAITDPDKVALGSVTGTVASDIAARLAQSAALDDGPDSAYQSMIANLGVTAQGVDRRAEIQQAITADIDAARDAFSGVNLDEEMTNMLMYQRGYEAASRVLTAIDTMLEQLVNRTGLVGR